MTSKKIIIAVIAVGVLAVSGWVYFGKKIAVERQESGAVASGIWVSQAEIMNLPTSGAAWDRVQNAANSSWGSACLYDNNCMHDVNTLAGALVAARTGDAAMRNKTIAGLQAAMGSSLSRALELSRGLQTYIIAADIIGHRTPEFEAWVREMITIGIQGHSGTGVLGTAENSPNNWGGHARASLAAAAVYLNDATFTTKVVNAHKAFIGLSAPNTMVYQSTNWHADPNNKAGVNRKGSTIQGKNVSGVLPEDWRRAAEYQWPPAVSGYMWEGIQGYVVAAVILHRAGLVSFNAGDNAVVRAMDMLYGKGEAASNSPVFLNPASGDDTWIPWVVNAYAGTTYPTQAASAGKNMGWTDWTHASPVSTQPPTKTSDLNTDGKVDVVDLGILLSAWGQTSKPKADINQDAKVDVVDLGILLGKWGTSG